MAAGDSGSYRREGLRSFQTRIQASAQCEPETNIRAAYTDGVLELTVEKRPESKPVKIQVSEDGPEAAPSAAESEEKKIMALLRFEDDFSSVLALQQELERTLRNPAFSMGFSG